jgi:sugar lactone lactonase YvrE
MRFNAAALVALCFASEPTRYLIVSAPKLAKIEYFTLPDTTPNPLIDTGLRSPQGLAEDRKRRVLYVADPDLRKVLSYELTVKEGTLLVEGQPTVAAQNVEARWVAVDGQGDLFFTDEAANVIMRVSSADVNAGNAHPVVVYSGAQTPEVNRPGGVAVDNFNVFWSNKAVGTQVGSVVKGDEEPQTAKKHVLAKIAENANKVYGVCLSQNNVFYTDTQKFLFGVKKSGGAIATVSDGLLGPRGCTWDGESTVFVADKAAGAIYSFPGNMPNLSPARLSKFASYDDAFGLAVVQSNAVVAVFAAALALLVC